MPSPSLKTNSGTESKSYTAAPAAGDIDMTEERPGYASSVAPHNLDNVKLRPRMIVVHSVGNLIVAYDEDKTLTDTIPCLAVPCVLPIQPYWIIDTGTTVANLTAVW